MQLQNLHQPGFNTSLMGVVGGALRYFEVPLSDAMVFGTTGHAFLINIHDVICPSGPYCWNYDGFFRQLRFLGITMNDMGLFLPDTPADTRRKVENAVVEKLNKGIPCSVLNMDNQLITGHENAHFILAVPWLECTEFTPSSLTFESWKEFGDGFHCRFFSIEKTGELQKEAAILHSLQYALELLLTPEKYCFEPYSGGLKAYDQWIEAIREGHGRTHGNWWNGMVWSECRTMAASYMDEIGQIFNADTRDMALAISSIYRVISQNMQIVAVKETDDSQKIELLAETRELEAGLIPKIELFLSLIC